MTQKQGKSTNGELLLKTKWNSIDTNSTMNTTDTDQQLNSCTVLWSIIYLYATCSVNLQHHNPQHTKIRDTVELKFIHRNYFPILCTITPNWCIIHCCQSVRWHFISTDFVLSHTFTQSAHCSLTVRETCSFQDLFYTSSSLPPVFKIQATEPLIIPAAGHFHPATQCLQDEMVLTAKVLSRSSPYHRFKRKILFCF